MTFSDEIVSFVVSQIQLNQSSTRLCFYLTLLSNLRMRFSFAIPSNIILSILNSFDSIVYKAAIRLFISCKESFLQALSSLSEEDQKKVLTLIVQHGCVLMTDIVAPKGKSQDSYSQELRNYLYFSYPNLTSFSFSFHTGMDAFILTNTAIFYMTILSYCAEFSAQWMQIMIDACMDLLVCTGLERTESMSCRG